MYKSILKLMLPVIGLTAGFAHADEFKLKSTDIAHGVFMKNTFEFQGFGCSGENKSPQLSWSGAPAGTQAYAIMAYDPDAPTGSGWWHWQVVNIPAEVTSIPSGNGKLDYKDVIDVSNDYGQKGFGERVRLKVMAHIAINSRCMHFQKNWNYLLMHLGH